MEIYKTSLTSILASLTDFTCNVSVLLNHLCQEGVLCLQEAETVRSKATDYDKKTEMYTIILRKIDDNCFDKLLKCLRNSDNSQAASKMLNILLSSAYEKVESKASMTETELTYCATIWKHSRKDELLVPNHQKFIEHIACNYDTNGKYKEMYEFGVAAFQKLEEYVGNSGTESLWTWRCGFWTGVALESLGRYDEALKIYRDVHKNQRANFGEKHVHTIATARNIGWIHFRKGKYSQAMSWYKNTPEKITTSFGNEHHEELSLKNNIASIKVKENKHAEALKIYEEVLVELEKNLGNKHQSTLSAKNNMAVTLIHQGRYKESLDAFKEILTAEEITVSSDHPSILKTKFNIAVTLNIQEKFNDALKMYDEVLSARERILGIEHPETIRVKLHRDDTFSKIKT